MKKAYLSLILFGFLLAILTVILQFSKYRYIIGSLDGDIYTSLVATIFTAIGVWLGVRLLGNKSSEIQEQNRSISESESTIDEAKIEELGLNDREYEILGLISQGLSNKEISEKLFIAIPTVKTHTSNLYSKLHVKSRTQAIHQAKLLNIL